MIRLIAAAAALAMLDPGHSLAVDMRPNTPAAACVQGAADDTVRNGNIGTFEGYSYHILDKGQSISVHCPISGGAAATPTGPRVNDIGKVRVHYTDGDGFGSGVVVSLRLIRYRLVNNGLVPQAVCDWDSNTAGTGAAGTAVAVFSCPHRLDPTYFYHFLVALSTKASIAKRSAAFYGLEFPSQ